MNPVDDTRFVRPLVRDLRAHVDAFTESMSSGRSYSGRSAARPVAVAWVYSTVLVAWAEDHGLIDPCLRVSGKARREEWLAGGLGLAGWVARGIGSLCVHPGTWCLLDPRWAPIRDGNPSGAVWADLVAWWADAPPLAYEIERGPASITGWLPGDLLQHLSDERRKGHALAQTPWWIADFIIDRTLLPAADEFRDEMLRTIDPAAGTGHFLVRKIEALWELYTTGELAPRSVMGMAPVAGWAPVSPTEAVRRILAGVHGCEVDPLTAAVARLRYVVVVGYLMHQAGLIRGPLRLDRVPPFDPPVVVGDSLLAGRVGRDEYACVHPGLAAIANLGYDHRPDAVQLAFADGAGAGKTVGEG